MVHNSCMHSCSCTMACWWPILDVKNIWYIINTWKQSIVWDWKLHYTLQCYTNRDASYKDISLWVDINIWSSYDAGTYWILIWNLELLGIYVMTVPCTYAFNRILSIPRSTKYSFFCLEPNFLSLLPPPLSVLQCHHLINAETFG